MKWIEIDSLTNHFRDLDKNEDIDLKREIQKFGIYIVSIDYVTEIDELDLAYFTYNKIEDRLDFKLLTRSLYDAEEAIVVLLYYLSIIDVEDVPINFGFQFTKIPIERKSPLVYGVNYIQYFEDKKTYFLNYKYFEVVNNTYKKFNKLPTALILPISIFTKLIFLTKDNDMIYEWTYNISEKNERNILVEILALAYYSPANLSLLEKHEIFRTLSTSIGLNYRLTLYFILDLFDYLSTHDIEEE